MTKEQCSGCKFWECEFQSIEDVLDSIEITPPDEPEYHLHTGKCRRFPPNILVPLDAEHDELFLTSNGDGLPDLFTHPYTRHEDWCGEFKPKP